MTILLEAHDATRTLVLSAQGLGLAGLAVAPSVCMYACALVGSTAVG